VGAAAASLAAVVRPTETNATNVAGAITDTATQARRLLLVALVPTASTLVYEWTTGTMPANWIRALAGLPLGASVAWLIGTLNVERDPEP